MKFRIIALIAAILCIASCQINEIESTSTDFYGHMEGFIDTKSSLDQNNNILWSRNDQLLIFNGSTLGSIYAVDANSAGETSASFNYVGAVSSGFVAGTDIHHNIAVYPMSQGIKCLKSDPSEPTKSYTLKNIDIVKEQGYSKDSFSQGSFPMVAVTKTVEDKELKFRNILGCLKLQLLGECTIKSITLSGNNGEVLAGSSDITVFANNSAPSMEIVSDLQTTVTLDCGENGVSLNMNTPEVFIFSIPPTDFTKGFTLTITDIDGKENIISTQKQNIVQRSTILKMPSIYVGDITSDFLAVSQPEVKFQSEGGEFKIEVMTNLEYDVVMPQVDWIKMEDATSIFKVLENKTNETRISEIIFKAKNTDQQATVTITQYCSDVINFKDELLEICCVAAYDTNNDGKLSYSEAAAVTSLNDMDVSVLYDRGTTFDEFQYFTSVKVLPKYYFEGIYVESITLPDNLRLIGSCAFREGFGVINIKDIQTWLNLEFSKEEPVMAFGGVIHLNGKPIVDVVIPEGTERIQDYLFSCFLDLKSVTLPSSVKYIGEGAFMESNLEVINIPEGVTYIGDYAFEWTNITTIHLPSTITYIGGEAFRNADIDKINIPEGVSTIHWSTFDGCHKLEEITLPSTIERIEESAFDSCENLKKVHISDLESWCKIQFELVTSNMEETYSNPLNYGANLYLNNEMLAELNIPEGITEIKAGAFINNKNITKVSLPSTITKIGDKAFYGCSGLKDILLPEGLQEIGNYAFYECHNLKTTLPNSLTKVGDYCFYNCYSLAPPTETDFEMGECAFDGCYNMNEIPEDVVDPDPSNTDFVYRAFITQYVGTNVPYVPAQQKIMNDLSKDDRWKDKYVIADVHSYAQGDPAYISNPKAPYYPYVTINGVDSFSYEKGLDALIDLLDEATARDIPRAGISVSSKLENNILIIDAKVKASKESNYSIGVWLLEDNIYGKQSDVYGIKESDPDYNYDRHNNCVRYIAGSSEGYPLGTIQQGNTQQMKFCMDISENWKIEDLHFIVFVSTHNKYDIMGVCNAIDCRPNTAIPFEYCQN